MNRVGSIVACGIVLLMLLTGSTLTGGGRLDGEVGAASAEPRAASTVTATFAETWRIEVRMSRFDPASIGVESSTATATAPPSVVFLTVIGTATNIFEGADCGRPGHRSSAPGRTGAHLRSRWTSRPHPAECPHIQP